MRDVTVSETSTAISGWAQRGSSQAGHLLGDESLSTDDMVSIIWQNAKGEA